MDSGQSRDRRPARTGARAAALRILQDAGKKDWRAAAEFLRLGFREDDSVRADIVVDAVRPLSSEIILDSGLRPCGEDRRGSSSSTPDLLLCSNRR
jgi:hypothetical protein